MSDLYEILSGVEPREVSPIGDTSPRGSRDDLWDRLHRSVVAHRRGPGADEWLTNWLYAEVDWWLKDIPAAVDPDPNPFPRLGLWGFRRLGFWGYTVVGAVGGAVLASAWNFATGVW